MSKRLIVSSLLLVLAAPAFAQNLKFEKYLLPNGMQVILHEDHTLPVACINTWYYVGSKDEKPGRSGFAHLFEHLMFMGTKRVPDNKFDVLMESGGGYNNASTAEDRTNYFSFGPSNLLPTLLWLDADRLEDLGKEMNKAKLDKQREVVRNERRQTSEMQPYGRADLKIPELMYPNDHPYHHTVIGSHEDLEAASVGDVVAFFNTYYVPNNASLVVAGDFDPAVIKPLVAKLFGTLPRQADAPHMRAEPVKLDGVVKATYHDAVQFARTTFVYHSPAHYKPGDAEMDLAGAILGDGKSSRLYQRLIYKDKLAVDVSASQGSMLLGSLFSIEITAAPGKTLDEIEAAADEAIAEFIAKGPTEDELKRQQASIETGKISGLQSILSRADLLNTYNFHLGTPDGLQMDLDRYRKATTAGVRDWAAKVLTKNARLELHVLPDEKIARDEQPAAEAPGAFKPPLPETFKLSNGVPVRYWHRPELPLVSVVMTLRGGAAIDDPAQAGCAFLTADMLDEGAGERGAVAFADALDMLGASFKASTDQEWSTASLAVLKRNLDPAMALFGDAILRPRFEQKEWDRVRDLHVQDLKRAEDRAPSVASRVGMLAFFGNDNAYGRPLDGTVESVKALTLDQIKQAHVRRYAPSVATLYVAGDLTAEEAKAVLEKQLGGWKAPGETPAGKPSFPPPANKALRVVVVDKPDAVQTVVRFYMPGPTYATPLRAKLNLLNVILGGGFTSRLNQNLREDHGYTYGARSAYAMGPSAGYFVASADVQTKVTGAAMGEFLSEFKRIRKGDVTEEEVTKARQTRRTGLIQSLQSLGGTVMTAAQLELNGAPFTAVADELREIETITAKDLNGLADDAIPLEQAVLILVGDKKAIAGQIKSLPLPTWVELSVAGEEKKAD